MGSLFPLFDLKKVRINLFFFLLPFIGLQAQGLTTAELLQISNRSNWEEVNTFLLSKGWEYYDSAAGSEENYSTVTWVHSKNFNDDKAAGWLYLYTCSGYPNKVKYHFVRKSNYNTFKNSLASSGFKYVDTEIGDDFVISNYSNLKFNISLSYAKDEQDEYSDASVTSYTVTLIKKYGKYDLANGVKKEYDDNGTVVKEYELKDGKLHGEMKFFFPNGKIQEISTFLNGKRNGLCKRFNEEGEREFECNYTDNVPSGSFKVFENNRLKIIGSNTDSLENGKRTEYDQDGQIVFECNMNMGVMQGKCIQYVYDEQKLLMKVVGAMFNDLKTGTWETTLYNRNGDSFLSDVTQYSNNLQNGAFRRASEDSIFVGTYKNGLLHGLYQIRMSVKTLVFGGISIDTSHCLTVVEGRYFEGLKTGYWRYHALNGDLLSEEQYLDDLKTGEWRYYVNTLFIQNSKKLSYSGKLFLIENYKMGMKNGREIRYGSLFENEVPCDTTPQNANPSDTCVEYVYQRMDHSMYYKNDMLHGPQELRDSLGILYSKGDFVNGKREGIWLEGYDNNSKSYPYYYYTGNYLNGLKEGVWKRYVVPDHIESEYLYEKGKLNGKSKEFDENMHLHFEKYFTNGNLIRIVQYDSLGVNVFNEYLIFDETADSYKCKLINYARNESYSQVYFIKKPSDHKISHRWFIKDFYTAVLEGSDGYRDGEYDHYDAENRLVETGFQFNNMRIGIWKKYFYDSDVYVVREFDRNISGVEHYYRISTDATFSGKLKSSCGFFESTCEIKIKKGLRDGKTKIFDSKGNVKKEEKYTDGILQE